MNSTGIAAAGGIGKYLTEWIIDGTSSINLWAFDVQRFVDLHNNNKFLKDRVSESLSKSPVMFSRTFAIVLPSLSIS